MRRARTGSRPRPQERAERARREQEQADELAEMARRDRELAEKRTAQAEKLDPASPAEADVDTREHRTR